MFKIDKSSNSIHKIKEQKFSELGFKEREHLQEWIAHNPDFFGEELLIIQKEFAGFDETNERLDLLAIDKKGDLVVIENKLDDSGRDVTWQVLKYASYCSSLSKSDIRDMYQEYLNKWHTGEDAGANIAEFLQADDFNEVELNSTQRLILVAGHFRKEVTNTVLWLLTNYAMKFQCFKVTPYQSEEQLFLSVEQIIPVKEAEDYTIKIAQKAQEEAEAKKEVSQRDHLRMEFWQEFLNKVQETGLKSFQNMSPTKDQWLMTGAGLYGVGFGVVITRQAPRVEVMIARPDAEENLRIFDALHKQKEHIEKAFGASLTWDRLEGKKSCRIHYDYSGLNYYERDSWPQIIDFFITSTRALENSFLEELQKLKGKL